MHATTIEELREDMRMTGGPSRDHQTQSAYRVRACRGSRHQSRSGERYARPVIGADLVKALVASSSRSRPRFWR